MTKHECVEVTALHSIHGEADTNPIHIPPFRNPHHTSSHSSVVGGGSGAIRPGEISLAHRGVLFLDEFPEFDRRVIESLREPLEEHTVTVTRTHGVARFPASCILVVAFNLCPCGNTGTDKMCTCSESAKMAYRKKLTGPIVDRIDVWVSVEATGFEELGSEHAVTTYTDTARRSVLHARNRQRTRYAGTDIHLNSEVDAGTIDTHIPLPSDASVVLRDAAEKLSLSPRGYHRTIKCARTIADLNDSDTVTADHILEAIGYRVPPVL